MITQEKLFPTDMTMEANWTALLSLEFTSTTVTPHGGRQSFGGHEIEQSFELLEPVYLFTSGLSLEHVALNDP